MRNKRKQPERTTVEFLDLNELKRIAFPLNEKAYDTMYELIDRYVDAKMKEYIVSKINWTSFDLDMEMKLKWLLEFKKFLMELYSSKGQK